MKSLGPLVAAVLAVAALTVHPAPAHAFKVGYVDLQRALTDSDAGKKAKAKFKAEVDKAEKQLKGKKDELERMKAELERKAVVMREEERRKKEGEFQHKQLDLKRRFEDSEVELRKKDAELTGQILQDLQKLIQKIGKEQDYDVIFELNASPIVYREPGNDITDEVLKRYNK